MKRSLVFLILVVLGAVAGHVGGARNVEGTGAAAQFNSPYGITTDGTSLYVADSNNSTIRKIVIATRAVTTIAGKAGSMGSTDASQ